MTLPWVFRRDDKFPGLWINKAGHVLFIERQPDSNIFLVSFAPSKEAAPIQRTYYSNKPTIRMPAEWEEDSDSLIVRLGPETEPSLHLTPEGTGFYYDGPRLVPAISTYMSQFEDEGLDLSWLSSLEPYRLAEEEKWEEFHLVRRVRRSKT